MKTMSKKLGAIVLALALCLSLCCSALAAETQTYSSTSDAGNFTIEIDPAYTGQTYNAYKIFDVTYNDAKSSYSYTITEDSPWFARIDAAETVFTLTKIGDSNVYNVALVDGASESDIIGVLSDIPSGITPDASVTLTRTGDESEKTSTTLTVTDPGYYFVTTTLGSVVSLDTTNPTATIEDKNTPPTVDKKVDGEEEESVDNHKTVTYTFDIDHVKGIHNLVLEDEMQVDQTQVSYTFDYTNMTVVLIDGDTQTPLVKDTDYTLIENPGDGCDFHIEFVDEWDNCSSEAHILVTIDCVLDAGENGFEDDEIEIPNHALVTYGQDGKSSWTVADVYEYGFDVYKYDGTDEGNTPLADAHFSLTNSSGQTAYFTADTVNNIYVLEGWGTATGTYVSDLVTDSTGNIKIEGLAEGTYTITETAAPDGYNMLTSPITVTITADETDPSIFSITVDGAENTGHTVNVANYAGQELPTTGGIGTTIFYIIGGVLVAGAVVVLITRRRMSNEG